MSALPAEATHYRGGQYSWAPVPGTNKIRFTFRHAWVCCTLYRESVNFGDGTSHSVGGQIVASDPAWVMNQEIVEHDYGARTGNVTVRMSNGNRISNLQNNPNGAFALETTVNLGTGNASPTTSLEPVIKCPANGTCKFPIPAADPNGDRLRFRMGTSYEAGSNNLPSGASIDATTGEYTLATVGKAVGNLYSANVMIEDLDAVGNVKSKVPVDFIIQIIQATGAAPSFSSQATPACSSTVTAPIGQRTQFSLTATDADVVNGDKIQLNIAGLPAGSSASPAVPVTLATSPAQTTFAWTPTAAQAGTYLLNVSAKDNSQQTAFCAITLKVPSNIRLDPANTVAPVSTAAQPSSVVLTATAMPNVVLTYTVTGGGPNNGLIGSVTTDANGQAQITIASNGAPGTDQVSFIFKDATGNNQTSEMAQITWDADKIAPVITVPANLTLEAANSSGAAATFSVSATDQSDPSPSLTCSAASGALFPLGTTTVSCSAKDISGNTSSKSFTITVVDTTKPSLTVPGDIAAEATSPGGASVAFTGVSATDSVSTPAVSCSPAASSLFPIGRTPVACTATDTAGNATTASFSVTVSDSTAPVVQVPANVTAEASSTTGAAVSYPTAHATDAVTASPAVACVPASGSTFAVGTTTVTCTARDSAGNTGTGSFTVAVLDRVAPSISVPADIAAEATSSAGAVVTYSGATATDAVTTAPPVNCLPASGSTFPLGPNVVTCTASDGAGNKAAKSFAVQVVDKTAPVVTVPANITVEATSAAGALASYSGVSATDAVTANPAISCSPASGAGVPMGTSTVSCVATDAAGNASAAKTFTITVADTTAPVLNVPANIKVEAASAAGAVVAYAGMSATDAVTTSPTIECSVPSGSTVALGQTTVSCTARDAAGNTSVPKTFNVSVVDTTAPTLASTADITVEATSAAGAVVTYSSPAATDAVTATPAVVCTPASGRGFALGSTPVSCTATDEAGNKSTKTFTAKVVDTTAPVLTVSADITVEATGPGGTIVNYPAASAVDGVTASPAIACSHSSGAAFQLGVTTVSCTATDAANNQVSKSFRVSVVDTTPPAIAVSTTGTAGLNGWFTSDVNVVWAVVDPQSGVASSTGCDSKTIASEGVLTLTCSAANGSGASATKTLQLKIDKTKPVVTPNSVVPTPNPVAVNTAFTIGANATDSGGSNLATAEYTLDTGAPVSLGALTGVSAVVNAAAKAISATGVYDVCVAVKDAAGNVSSKECILLPVYDPSGAFVTGGGWIKSPVNALQGGSPEGKASFGFVSKYQKGQNVPTGVTEFNFELGAFKFASTSYEWLVVSGAKAQYKGTGAATLNGATVPDLAFLLTATDAQVTGGGTVDKFRIKIWNKSTNQVLYDNVTSGGDTLDTANPQEIGGGNIVIHSAK